MLFESLQHGTARLVAMGAVPEAAIVGELEYLGEEMRHLLGSEIDGSKPLDTRRVDDIAAIGQWEHFGKRRRVHTLVMRLRDGSRLQIEPGQDKVYE